MTDPEPHPLANLFPLLAERDLGELADDICTFGLRNPIVLYEGKVLDGRNRLAACRIAGVEPQFTEYGGDEPLSYVISQNIVRRHLNESQRAILGAKIANYPSGGNQHNVGNRRVSKWKAAKLLNVSERSIASAKRLLSEGVPELIDSVQTGNLAVSRAEKYTHLGKAEQRAIARQPIQKKRELSVYKLVGGERLEDLSFGELNEMIRRLESDLTVLRKISNYASNHDPECRIGEFYSFDKLCEFAGVDQ